MVAVFQEMAAQSQSPTITTDATTTTCSSSKNDDRSVGLTLTMRILMQGKVDVIYDNVVHNYIFLSVYRSECVSLSRRSG